MLSFKDAQRQLVLPAWFDFEQAAKIGELSTPRKTPFKLIEREQTRFDKAVLEFQANPQRHIASDVFGFALSVGREDIAREAALSLVKDRDLHPAAVALAEKYLRSKEDDSVQDWRIKVRDIRKLLLAHPRNPIAWVEQARAYTILGQHEPAERALKMALKLAPDNRYVLRSAARFYIHIKQPETAWRLFQDTQRVEFDPWLKSCELNLSVLANKAPKRIPKDDVTAVLKHDLFYYSELLESVGMMHLIAGKDKFARRSFEAAWPAASHNVVTHAEWVTRKHFPALEEKISGKFKESLEALTFSEYFDHKIEGAAKAACQWASEEPYSRKSGLMVTYMLSLLGNYDLAARYARAALDTNPDDCTTRNNLVFVLLRSGNIGDAEKEHRDQAVPTNIKDQICYIATKGLLHFKQGKLELGRELYAEAIAMSEKEGDKRLANMARLNLALAELEVGGADVAAIAGGIVEQIGEDKNPDVQFMRERVTNSILTFEADSEEHLPSPPNISITRSHTSWLQDKLQSLFRRER